MSLPKITTPIYTVTLPSNGKSVRIRPFLVKEEKLLLIAAQTKDTNEIIETTKQVINNCLIDNDVSVDNLPFFDIDYLIVALRAKSVGETIPVNFTCNNIVDDQKCGHIFSVDIDISKASVVKDESVSPEIWLSSDFGVKMKYPKYSAIKAIMSNETELDKVIRIICASIDYIFDKDEVYSTKDKSKEEIQEFVENLTKVQLEKLKTFVENFPEFECRVEQTCKKCGFEHKIRYNNFDSFFFIIFGHDTLVNYYKTNFNLMQFHHYSLSDIENMLPWERYLYLDMLRAHVQEENEKARERQMMLQRQMRK